MQPRYVRNFVQAGHVVTGAPIRSVFMDVPNDLTVKGFRDRVISFNEDDRTIYLPPEVKELRFPRRPEEDGGEIAWTFEPTVADLCAGDSLDYLGDNIKVHDVYRRPGADWARVTWKEPGKGKSPKLTRVFCNLDSIADNRVLRLGDRSWQEFELETAGYYEMLDSTEGPIRFFVSPIGRGDYPLAGCPTTGRERRAPDAFALKRSYIFTSPFDTYRYPNDGNAPRRFVTKPGQQSGVTFGG